MITPIIRTLQTYLNSFDRKKIERSEFNILIDYQNATMFQAARTGFDHCPILGSSFPEIKSKLVTELKSAGYFIDSDEKNVYWTNETI